MRLRKKPIVDIKITMKELKKIKKGYRVYRMVDGKHYCIMNKVERKEQRIIEQLKEKIRELESRHKK